MPLYQPIIVVTLFVPVLVSTFSLVAGFEGAGVE
jgi:hypothetical protein